MNEHDEAKEIVLRLIAGSFRRDGEPIETDKRPRFSIPCRPEHDDDCRIVAYIERQAAAADAHDRRVAELLAANNAEVEHRREVELRREAATLLADVLATLAAADRQTVADAIKILLADFYTPTEVEAWLAAAHPLLAGRVAAELIAAGRAAEVLRVIAQLRESVYV